MTLCKQICIIKLKMSITDEFIVDKLTDCALASTNSVYVQSKKQDYIELYNETNNKKAIFKVLKDNSIVSNEIILLNAYQRTYMGTTLNTKLKCKYVTEKIQNIESITFVAKNLLSKANPNVEINDDTVKNITTELNGVVAVKDLQLSYMNKISLIPNDIKDDDLNKTIGPDTKIKIISTDKSINIDCSNDMELFNGNFNFQDLGIGGLDKQFEIIFRRAFSSRLIHKDILKNLGVNHVRGIILHGVVRH